jgi:putative transcriptional regulator
MKAGPRVYFAARMAENQPDPTLDKETRERLERLKSGCVLLARDTLKDPNFDRTVVLICVYGEDGAYGVVMNRPSHMPLSEMFDGFAGMNITRRIMIGGPVRQNELQIIQITDTPVENAFEVAKGVFLGGQWEDLHRLLECNEESSYLFLGYSGWAPGQLEYEVIAGAWDVYTVDVERFLRAPIEQWSGSEEQVRSRLEALRR